MNCIFPVVPIDCQWGAWSAWSGCSQACGGGIQLRHRISYQQALNDRLTCLGSSLEQQVCNTGSCVNPLPSTTTALPTTSTTPEGKSFNICEKWSDSIIFLSWGFTAYVSCGGNFSNASGTLTSPLHPESYPDRALCTYIISQPEGTYINVSLISMDIKCVDNIPTSDFIEVRDGMSEESPLMGRFCGNGSSFPLLMQTTQNYLRIR